MRLMGKYPWSTLGLPTDPVYFVSGYISRHELSEQRRDRDQAANYQ